MSAKFILTGEQRNVMHRAPRGPTPVPVYRMRLVDNNKYLPASLLSRMERIKRWLLSNS